MPTRWMEGQRWWEGTHALLIWVFCLPLTLWPYAPQVCTAWQAQSFP